MKKKKDNFPFGDRGKFKKALDRLRKNLDNCQSAFVEAYNQQEWIEDDEMITTETADEDHYMDLRDLCECYHQIRTSQKKLK
jgi:hypothetical protein